MFNKGHRPVFQGGQCLKKEKRYRFRRLYFQISMIIIPLFLIIAGVIALIVYNSTLRGFLEAQDSLMSRQLDLVMGDTCFTTDAFTKERVDWYFDKIEEYSSELLDNDTPVDTQALEEFKKTDKGTVEQIEKAPKNVQFSLTKEFYEAMFMTMVKSYVDYDTTKLFVIDASETHKGMVICDLARSGQKRLGDKFDIDFSEHPQLKKLIDSENNSGKTVFELSHTFPDKGSYYIGYMPLEFRGKTRAILGVVYDWNEFNDALHLTIIKTMIICAGALVIFLALLQIIIYRRATAPVTAIQGTVREYKQDKDSEKVVSAMARIKVRNELGLLSQDISELAKEIDFYTAENVRLAAEKERVAAELDMAKKIQADQLPSDFPDRKEFDIYASMTPAKEVGGDFYDLFFVDDDHLALVIADVSGKGVPAALFMMMSKNIIHNLASMGLSPKEVMESANRTICANNKQRMFVTVWLGILEISTGRVTAVNAGHEIPMICQPGGEFELFEEPHGVMVGVFPKAEYEQYEFVLKKGGSLFVYTDGVAEATNASDEMFRTDRLLTALNEHKGGTQKQLLESVQREVERFAADAEQSDDLTMLGITIH